MKKYENYWTRGYDSKMDRTYTYDEISDNPRHFGYSIDNELDEKWGNADKFLPKDLRNKIYSTYDELFDMIDDINRSNINRWELVQLIESNRVNLPNDFKFLNNVTKEDNDISNAILLKQNNALYIVDYVEKLRYSPLGYFRWKGELEVFSVVIVNYNNQYYHYNCCKGWIKNATDDEIAMFNLL